MRTTVLGNQRDTPLDSGPRSPGHDRGTLQFDGAGAAFLNPGDQPQCGAAARTEQPRQAQNLAPMELYVDTADTATGQSDTVEHHLGRSGATDHRTQFLFGAGHHRGQLSVVD
ncbi:hypothetical protein C1S81_14860 [Mycolicibacterium neoaurum]|nr:hypothetical protein C1S81_14860 [Mycolicibacterium neoaurum]